MKCNLLLFFFFLSLTAKLFSHLVRNTRKIEGFLGNGISRDLIPHHINFSSSVSPQDYKQMTDILKGVMENDYSRLGLDSCSIEDELNKVCHTTPLTF